MHSENLTKIINTEDIRNYLILKFNVFLLLCVFDLSLSSYQVWPRSQTEDLGSHPSKCMLKFFNFFFNFCYTYKKKNFMLRRNIVWRSLLPQNISLFSLRSYKFILIVRVCIIKIIILSQANSFDAVDYHRVFYCRALHIK